MFNRKPAPNADTIRNVMRRYVEVRQPDCFASRMACQTEALMHVAEFFGIPITADTVTDLGERFAEVCPPIAQ